MSLSTILCLISFITLSVVLFLHFSIVLYFLISLYLTPWASGERSATKEGCRRIGDSGTLGRATRSHGASYHLKLLVEMGLWNSDTECLP